MKTKRALLHTSSPSTRLGTLSKHKCVEGRPYSSFFFFKALTGTSDTRLD
ncbi:MAG: hypothetical protein RRA15_10185 [bacterium]|nr:hypothetical protein [bacterium]MDT8366844.1 hypothetical protein [bacterium]